MERKRLSLLNFKSWLFWIVLFAAIVRGGILALKVLRENNLWLAIFGAVMLGFLLLVMWEFFSSHISISSTEIYYQGLFSRTRLTVSEIKSYGTYARTWKTHTIHPFERGPSRVLRKFIYITPDESFDPNKDARSITIPYSEKAFRAIEHLFNS